MKLIVLILISINIFQINLRDNSIQSEKSTMPLSCPIGQNADIFILMRVLLSADFLEKRRLLDIPEFDAEGIESVSLEGNVSKHLHTFWSNKGVNKVAESVVCIRLNEIAIDRGLMEQDSYHLAFYAMDGKFILFHLTDRVSDKRKKTAITLSSDYSIIGEIEF